MYQSWWAIFREKRHALPGKAHTEGCLPATSSFQQNHPVAHWEPWSPRGWIQRCSRAGSGGGAGKDRGTCHPTKGETQAGWWQRAGVLPEWGAQVHAGLQGLPSTARAAPSSLCLGSDSNTNAAARWMNEHIGRICQKINGLQMIA